MAEAGETSRLWHSFCGPRNSEVNLFIKYFLFLFNFVLWLVGLVMIGLMSWLIYEKQKVVKTAFDFIFDPTILLCLFGCIAIVICLFGWLGSLREISWCLTLYSGILSFFLLVEIVVIVFAFIFYYVPDVVKTLKLYPEDILRNAIVTYRDDTDQQNLIDSMQRDLACCGVSNDDIGYKDWNQNPYFNCSNDKSNEKCSVPFSCCKIKPGDPINYMCGGGALSPDNSNPQATINTIGCLRGLRVFLESNALWIGGIVIGILIPQGVLIFCGKTLKGQIWAQKAKWRR